VEWGLVDRGLHHVEVQCPLLVCAKEAIDKLVAFVEHVKHSRLCGSDEESLCRRGIVALPLELV
jgi:hypothetical protein